MSELKPPPIPQFSWANFTKNLRETRRVLKPYANQHLAGVVFQRLQIELTGVLPDRAAGSVLQTSLNHLVGATLGPRELNQLAYRLTAQREYLANGTPLRLESEETGSFWAAAQIVDAWSANRGKKFGTSISFRLVSTTAAPVDVPQWWSYRQTSYRAYYRNEKRHGVRQTRQRPP